MSKISELIFQNAKHYITSNFGWRTYTYNGEQVTDFHNGTDYGTDLKKIPQYAIEDGEVISAGQDSSGGRFAWIKYPRLNVKMLHYHLDSVAVKAGQAVSRGTLVGYTGTTGKSTGVHLHLGIMDLATGKYLDPENYAKGYTDPTVEPTPTKSVEELANEVITGLWGNGEDRRNRLTKAGYDYSQVQARVNEIMAPKPAPVPEPSHQVYTVQRGDNLSSIAREFGTTWQKIYEDNKDLIDSMARSHGVMIRFYNYIYAGQQLIIK